MCKYTNTILFVIVGVLKDFIVQSDLSFWAKNGNSSINSTAYFKSYGVQMILFKLKVHVSVKDCQNMSNTFLGSFYPEIDICGF